MIPEPPGGPVQTVVVNGTHVWATPSGRIQWVPATAIDGGTWFRLNTPSPAGWCVLVDTDPRVNGHWTRFPDLTEPASHVAAQAISLSAWWASNTFCPQCGLILAPQQGREVRWRNGRRCAGCGHVSWPRHDPVVVVLVKHRDLQNQLRILLVRRPGWEPERWSLVAGHVDAGESFETAALREVAEETGVICTDVQCVASQPWPVPNELVMGLVATTPDSEAPPPHVVAHEELVEARWFTAAEIKHKDGERLILPGECTMSRQLVDRFLRREK
ncbi:NADH pyrophosphatase [Austwickia sp. TVS 96-490-7B]|uniref:NAD(+) diphosphatase n=1 Tax=Austwickia sp. TVS 96-490-7B TaxID=2830843 RepID=UPI001DEF305E|nr:NADH pyrophosphatase [Austwickia sp. TVS 96-490-7B]